jgi:hypothetical protein
VFMCEVWLNRQYEIRWKINHCYSFKHTNSTQVIYDGLVGDLRHSDIAEIRLYHYFEIRRLRYMTELMAADRHSLDRMMLLRSGV